MKKVNDLMPGTNTHTSQNHTTTQAGPIDSDLVNKFFRLLEGVYGAAAMKSLYPTGEQLKVAKRMWAPMICKHTWAELQGKVQYAMAMKHQAEWRFPDIGLILNGQRQPGASGIAAASYKPAAEVLNALPPPPQNKARGQAMLDALKAELDASSEAEKKKARDEVNAMRAELAELEAKHVPYGQYLRRTADGDYVPSGIAHPMRSLASEGREFCWLD